MEFGPDGALYVLEYGDGFFSESPEAQLSRIDFVRGNYTPIPQVAAEPTTGLAPLTVTFSSAGTTDPDGDPIMYEWDFDMDGTVDSTEPNPTFTYEENGVFDATLKVTDSTGRSAAASVPIISPRPQPLGQHGRGAPSADGAPRPTSERGRQADHGLLKEDEDRARQVTSGLAVLATVHRPVDQACFDVAGPIVGVLS